MSVGEMAQSTFNEALSLIEAGQTDDGVDLLRQAASTGDPQALFVLGGMTWAGNLVAQDPPRGRLLFEYAAALGHQEANILATNLMANGVAGRRNWPLALERLAEEGRVIPERREAAELIAAMQLEPNGGPTATPEPRLLSQEPYARLFERLLSPQECAYLISAAEGRFEPSMVYNRARELVRDTIRTSEGAAFHWLIEDPAIHALNRRVAAATRTTYSQGEALQALRYSPGQEYRPHFDYVEGVENRRIWTALIYLNEDYEGGATEFVRTGLQVRGRAGDVLVFRNAREDDEQDPLAQHAGLPVTAGTKYLATRWIRERRWIP
jgi:prolyl 4-hydroxylase